MSGNKNTETIIGLEIHVQLKTKSKMFCGCSNEGEYRPPNTTVCEVCTGQPGTLPAPNVEALRMAVKIALALGCRVNSRVKFDRKHYFYPDLPKGYQISQYDLPIGEAGRLQVQSPKSKVQSEEKFLDIRITRVHLEEDTAKLMHTPSESLVNFNRSGTPLVEIVTEPDFRDPAETKMFLQLLRATMRVIGVSDADMEKGHLRCDANISLREIADGSAFVETSADKRGHKTQTHANGKADPTPLESLPYDKRRKGELKPKVEIKNLNSFRNVEQALAFEQDRLSKLLEAGHYPTSNETRGWNEGKSRTEPQRTKEEAHDYRYMPEPDIPMLFLFEEKQTQNSKLNMPHRQPAGEAETQNEGKGLFDLEEIRREIPELPQKKWERFKREYGFSDTYLAVIVEDQFLADYLEETISELTEWLMALPEVEGTDTEVWDRYGAKMVKLVSDWMLNRVAELLKSRGERFKDLKVTPENFAEFLSMIYSRRISSTIAKTLLGKLIAEGGDPSEALLDMGGEQVSKEDELEHICSRVLLDAPDEALRYKAGKTALIQFFIGKAMQETKGKGNPEVLKKIFEEKLST